MTSMRKDFLNWWERMEWRLTAITALLGFVLGCLGFWRQYESLGLPDSAWNWTDVVYGTIQLFLVQVVAEEGSAGWPLTLQVARFLAPLSVFWAAIRGLLVVVHGRVQDRRWERFLTSSEGHVVLLGSDGISSCLMERLVDSGDDVVRIVADERIEAFLEGRHRAFGPYAMGEALKRARIEHAREVVVATGDDHQNIRQVEEIRQTLAARGNPGSPVPCLVEMGPDRGSPLHEQEAANRLAGEGLLAVRLFQPERVAARVLVERMPPHQDRMPDRGDSPIHALVIGFEPLGREVVRQLIRVCHYPDLSRVRLTVVAEGAMREWRRFQKQVPALGDVAEVAFVDADPGAMNDGDWDRMQEAGPFDVVYITTADQEDAFAVALDARDGLGSARLRTRVIMCGHRSAFIDAEGAADHGVDVLDHPREAWSVENLLRDEIEKAAMGIHERYHANRQSKSDYGDRPADRPWEQLHEHLRDGNRDQADHIPVKLQVLGVSASELIARTSGAESEDASSLELGESELEALAEMEHRRWWASAALSGQVLGPERNSRLRHHPDMRPYADLDEPTRQYDRDAVVGLPALLRYLEGQNA